MCVLIQTKSVGRPREYRNGILELFAQKGTLSIPKLCELIEERKNVHLKKRKKVHPNAIKREIDAMIPDGLIEKIDTLRESHKHGKPTYYYKIKTEGMKLYEKTLLDINKNDWIPQFFDNYLNNYEEYFTSNLLEKSFLQRSQLRRQVIIKIGLGKPMSLSQIIKFLDAKKISNQNLNLNYLTSNGKHEKGIMVTENIVDKLQELIKEMVMKNILQHTKKDHKIFFELTHLGLLELLFDLYNNEKLSVIESQVFDKKIQQIMKKYSHLLPDVFSEPTKLRIKPYEIGLLLIFLYRKPIFDYSRSLGSVEELVDKLNNITSSSASKYHIQKVFKQLRQDSYNKKLSEYCLKMQDAISSNNKIKEFKKQDFDFDEMSSYSNCLKLITDRITIDFLLLYSVCFPIESKKFLQDNNSIKHKFISYNSRLGSFVKANIEINMS